MTSKKKVLKRRKKSLTKENKLVPRHKERINHVYPELAYFGPATRDEPLKEAEGTQGPQATTLRDLLGDIWFVVFWCLVVVYGVWKVFRGGL